MIQALENVGIVVSDLPAARDFFVALGMEVMGEASVEGEWVDRVLGTKGVRSHIVMLRTADGHGRLELMTYRSPEALPGDPAAPMHTLGRQRLCFTVADLDAAVRVAEGAGGRLMGEVVDYEGVFRICYLRGPEDIIIMVSQPLAERPE